MSSSKYWKELKGKKVRLIIIDGKKIKPRDGIFKDSDDTHVFLEITKGSFPKPFLKSNIKRIDIKKEK